MSMLLDGLGAGSERFCTQGKISGSTAGHLAGKALQLQHKINLCGYVGGLGGISFADGAGGWLAHLDEGVLFIKQFPDLPLEVMAPGELETWSVQVFNSMATPIVLGVHLETQI